MTARRGFHCSDWMSYNVLQNQALLCAPRGAQCGSWWCNVLLGHTAPPITVNEPFYYVITCIQSQLISV